MVKKVFGGKKFFGEEICLVKKRFLVEKALVEGRSPTQELEVGPCSRLYLLVYLKGVTRR